MENPPENADSCRADFLQQLVQRFLGMKGKRRRFGCFNHGQFLLTPTLSPICMGERELPAESRD